MPFDMSRYSTRIKAEIAQLETEMAELTKRLADLRAAERVLADYDNANASPEEQDDDDKGPKVADKISEVLILEGAMSIVDILEYLQKSWRDNLTKGTVVSTLHRMKEKEVVFNEDGKWDFVKKKRP
jgi:hypothetical protein